MKIHNKKTVRGIIGIKADKAKLLNIEICGMLERKVSVFNILDTFSKKNLPSNEWAYACLRIGYCLCRNGIKL